MLAFALAAVLAASSAVAPRAPVVSSGSDRVKADIGSFCVQGTTDDGQEVGLCSDSAPPTKPPSPRLHVARAERIEVRFRHRTGLADEVTGFSAELARIGGAREFVTLGPLKPVRIAGTRRAWELRLPQNLRRANALVIFATLESGDAMFTVGLRRVPSDAPEICPATGGRAIDTAELVGLTIDQARAHAARVGCTLRVSELDGVSQPGTSDYLTNRVNVAVRNGSVERIFGVG